MPSNETEVRLVAEGGAGNPPRGLRVAKTVKSEQSGSYLVPLPGMLPPGFHISLHPSGELHLKARDFGVIARVNLGELIGGLVSGDMDELLLQFVGEPEAGLRAKGVVVPRNVYPGLSKLGAGESGPVALSLAELAEAASFIEIDDTKDLAHDLEWLREQGELNPGGMKMLSVDGQRHEHVFMNLLGRGARTTVAVPLPQGTPFPKTVAAVLHQLSQYGGFFIRVPSEAEFAKVAERAGLGEFYRGLSEFVARLDEGENKGALESLIREFAAGAAPWAAKLVAHQPLAPEDRGEGSPERGRRDLDSP